MQPASGSDWFTLSSKFVHYLVNKNKTTMNTIKSFYKYSVHPLEVTETTYLRPRINRTFEFYIFDLTGVTNALCVFIFIFFTPFKFRIYELVFINFF